MKTVLELEDLASRAVKAALGQQWQEAIALNKEYLEDNPKSIETLNRLARALQETGQKDQAKQTYQQVLDIDPYNSIAQKNLEKLIHGTSLSLSHSHTELFLDEPGRTRIANIFKPELKKIAKFASGQQLEIADKNGQLALLSPKDQVLGFLEEDLSSHLKNLIGLGNTYSAHLMSTSDQPQVFLRELHQSAAASKFISFTKSHSSTSHANLSARDRHLASDDPLADGNLVDEEVDNWDSESADSSNHPDDDFDSVSLEQMREDEDGNYSANEY